jgi:predicted RND superfamily exporter protein
VIALIPLALGTVWAAGLLSLFDFKLNLANVWGAPLIIGASAEYGLNIVTRVMEAREHGGPVFPRSTTSAVALNGLTTIAGFGSLLVAHHRGIWSLGLLLTVGSLTSLIAALIVVPLLVGLFDRAAVGIDRTGDPACDSSL